MAFKILAVVSDKIIEELKDGGREPSRKEPEGCKSPRPYPANQNSRHFGDAVKVRRNC